MKNEPKSELTTTVGKDGNIQNLEEGLEKIEVVSVKLEGIEAKEDLLKRICGIFGTKTTKKYVGNRRGESIEEDLKVKLLELRAETEKYCKVPAKGKEEVCIKVLSEEEFAKLGLEGQMELAKTYVGNLELYDKKAREELKATVPFVGSKVIPENVDKLSRAELAKALETSRRAFIESYNNCFGNLIGQRTYENMSSKVETFKLFDGMGKLLHNASEYSKRARGIILRTNAFSKSATIVESKKLKITNESEVNLIPFAELSGKLSASEEDFCIEFKSFFGDELSKTMKPSQDAKPDEKFTCFEQMLDMTEQYVTDAIKEIAHSRCIFIVGLNAKQICAKILLLKDLAQLLSTAQKKFIGYTNDSTDDAPLEAFKRLLSTTRKAMIEDFNSCFTDNGESVSCEEFSKKSQEQQLKEIPELRKKLEEYHKNAREELKKSSRFTSTPMDAKQVDFLSTGTLALQLSKSRVELLAHFKIHAPEDTKHDNVCSNATGTLLKLKEVKTLLDDLSKFEEGYKSELQRIQVAVAGAGEKPKTGFAFSFAFSLNPNVFYHNYEEEKPKSFVEVHQDLEYQRKVFIDWAHDQFGFGNKDEFKGKNEGQKASIVSDRIGYIKSFDKTLRDTTCGLFKALKTGKEVGVFKVVCSIHSDEEISSLSRDDLGKKMLPDVIGDAIGVVNRTNVFLKNGKAEVKQIESSTWNATLELMKNLTIQLNENCSNVKDKQDEDKKKQEEEKKRKIEEETSRKEEERKLKEEEKNKKEEEVKKKKEVEKKKQETDKHKKILSTLNTYKFKTGENVKDSWFADYNKVMAFVLVNPDTHGLDKEQLQTLNGNIKGIIAKCDFTECGKKSESKGVTEAKKNYFNYVIDDFCKFIVIRKGDYLVREDMLNDYSILQKCGMGEDIRFKEFEGHLMTRITNKIKLYFKCNVTEEAMPKQADLVNQVCKEGNVSAWEILKNRMYNFQVLKSFVLNLHGKIPQKEFEKFEKMLGDELNHPEKGYDVKKIDRDAVYVPRDLQIRIGALLELKERFMQIIKDKSLNELSEDERKEINNIHAEFKSFNEVFGREGAPKLTHHSSSQDGARLNDANKSTMFLASKSKITEQEVFEDCDGHTYEVKDLPSYFVMLSNSDKSLSDMLGVMELFGSKEQAEKLQEVLETDESLLKNVKAACIAGIDITETDKKCLMTLLLYVSHPVSEHFTALKDYKDFEMLDKMDKEFIQELQRVGESICGTMVKYGYFDHKEFVESVCSTEYRRVAVINSICDKFETMREAQNFAESKIKAFEEREKKLKSQYEQNSVQIKVEGKKVDGIDKLNDGDILNAAVVLSMEKLILEIKQYNYEQKGKLCDPHQKRIGVVQSALEVVVALHKEKQEKFAKEKESQKASEEISKLTDQALSLLARCETVTNQINTFKVRVKQDDIGEFIVDSAEALISRLKGISLSTIIPLKKEILQKSIEIKQCTDVEIFGPLLSENIESVEKVLNDRIERLGGVKQSFSNADPILCDLKHLVSERELRGFLNSSVNSYTFHGVKPEDGLLKVLRFHYRQFGDVARTIPVMTDLSKKLGKEESEVQFTSDVRKMAGLIFIEGKYTYKETDEIENGGDTMQDLTFTKINEKGEKVVYTSAKDFMEEKPKQKVVLEVESENSVVQSEGGSPSYSGSLMDDFD